GPASGTRPPEPGIRPAERGNHPAAPGNPRAEPGSRTARRAGRTVPEAEPATPRAGRTVPRAGRKAWQAGHKASSVEPGRPSAGRRPQEPARRGPPARYPWGTWPAIPTRSLPTVPPVDGTSCHVPAGNATLSV